MTDRPSFRLRIFNLVEPVTSMYPDLIPYWRSLGWQVETVISKTQYRAKRPQRWVVHCSSVHWTPSFGLRHRRSPGKLLIMLAYIIYAGLLSLIGPRVDHNLFLTQPPLFFVWGVVLQRLRSQPFTIVLMDLYPDVAIQAGLLTQEGLLTGLLLRLSRYGLQRADKVIAIGRCMEKRLLALGLDDSRIKVIPNWVDETAIVPLFRTENSFRYQMGWQDKFVVMYSGNIGISHNFTDILEVARRLKKNSELVFVFVGDGRRWPEIEYFITKHRLSNIKRLPFQPQSQLAQSLGAGDLHFICLRPGFAGLVVPSKTYGVLAAGRPILFQGEKAGEIARLIDEEDVGQIVTPGDTTGLEKAILRYLNDPFLLQRQGENGRRLAEGRYSKQAAQQAYTALFAPASIAQISSLLSSNDLLSPDPEPHK